MLISKAKDLVPVLVPQPRGTRQPAEAPEEKAPGARKGGRAMCGGSAWSCVEWLGGAS